MSDVERLLIDWLPRLYMAHHQGGPDDETRALFLRDSGTAGFLDQMRALLADLDAVVAARGDCCYVTSSQRIVLRELLNDAN